MGTAKHRDTWQTSEYQCPTSQHGSIFDPLLGVFWWFRDAGVTEICLPRKNPPPVEK